MTSSGDQSTTPPQDAADGIRYDDLTTAICLTAAGALHPKIRHAVRHIERHYHQKLTLRSVADRIRFHPNHLCRRFREALGMPFSEYLVRVRLKKAIGGLVYTDDPIKEVGYRAGFGGPERFSTVFRQWLRCSPRSFRSRYRYGELTKAVATEKR